MDSSNRLFYLRAVLTPGPVVLCCAEEQMAQSLPLRWPALTYVTTFDGSIQIIKKKNLLFINEAINCYSSMAKSYPPAFQSAFTILVKPKSTYSPEFLFCDLSKLSCCTRFGLCVCGSAVRSTHTGQVSLA